MDGRWSKGSGAAGFAACALLILGGCQPEEISPTVEAPVAASAPSGPAIFKERATDRGLEFVHFNGMSGELYIAEVMGSGVALLDYDNDGDLDVYLVQGSVFQGRTFPPSEAMRPLTDRLYRNDLTAGGGPRFTDVTEESGLSATGYGMGVATGDIDNDGWVDLYVTNMGSNQLWRNLGPDTAGRVTFEDVTAKSGADDASWSVSATFLDFDRDGWLDLYVVSYVDFTVTGTKRCKSLTGAADYCGPISYRPRGDRLLRNRGGGVFEDWSPAITAAGGTGLGVVSGDFDGDGRVDLYVANDGTPNFMWLQQEDGSFRDEGLNRGNALSLEGMAEAGMGVVAGDGDGDGDEDLLVTHLALETNTLYLNDGAGFFDDTTVASGLGTASFTATGFGAAFLDYDNDGWLDLMAVNGAVKKIPELVASQEPYPLHMPNLLFRNLGAGSGVRFEEVSATGGEDFLRSEVSRGLAVGDLDNDGDTDVVLSNNSGPARLLLNQIGSQRHWLGLRLVGGDPPRDMLGAVVTVERAASPTLERRVRTGGSYLSANDPRVLFGLGDDPAFESVRVEWPSGREERFRVDPDRYTTLREGSGEQIRGEG